MHTADIHILEAHLQNNDVSDYSLGQLQSFLLQHAFQQFLEKMFKYNFEGSSSGREWVRSGKR